MMVSFVLSFFPRDVLDEILKLIESVSEDFPSYSDHILSFILSLLEEGQLLVTSQSMCSEYMYRLGGLSLPRQSVVALFDRPEMTIAV